MLKQAFRVFSQSTQYIAKSPRPEGLPEQVYSIFKENYDVVVIGGGVSGLYSAINLSRQGFSTAIVSKVFPTRSNSCKITEGLNGLYSSKDDLNFFYQSTMKTSGSLSSPIQVESFCKSSPMIISDLQSFGFPFPLNMKGEVDSSPNPENPFISWAKCGDLTGHILLQTLTGQALKHKVKILSDFFALDLILQGNECKGVVSWNLTSGDIHVIQASSTILATGGYGRVFSSTSQSQGSTGDGNSMIARAGLPNQNLEFVKYKPLSLAASATVIETSVLNKAKLVNRNFEEFLSGFEENKVCVAMANEIQRGRGAGPKQDHLYLDVSGVDESQWKVNYLKHFPYGSSLLPVQPSVYRTLGGVPTNDKYQVVANDNCDVVDNLYAVGQVAFSQVSGADLHIGNSLSESLFLARGVSQVIQSLQKPSRNHSEVPKFIQESSIERLEKWRVKKGSLSIFTLKKKLQTLITRFSGIVKNKENLEEGLRKINELWGLTSEVGVLDRGLKFNLEVLEALELESMVIVGKQLIAASLMREESRGCHIREDFPKTSEDWTKHTLTWLQSPDGDVGLHTRVSP
jgi:succinate dehydrogenase/fumarate reductase flavoprotein subunit